MARFHNAPSDFANLASGETGIGYRSPQKRKEFFFKIGLITMPKRIGYKIYIFYLLVEKVRYPKLV